MRLILCETCHKSFLKHDCHIKRVKHNYCSVECTNKGFIKKETILCKFCGTPFEYSESNRGRYSTCASPKCRLENKTRNNNPNWKGGITKNRLTEMSRKPYKMWRKGVFERDNFTCQICGKRGGTLNADHIKSWAFYPELRYDPNNGRTLCLKCHRTTYKLVWDQRKVVHE